MSAELTLFASLVKSLKGLSQEELRAKASSWFPEKDQARLSKLLEYNRQRKLTAAETEEAEALLDKVEAHATEVAAARLLLKNPDAEIE